MEGSKSEVMGNVLLSGIRGRSGKVLEKKKLMVVKAEAVESYGWKDRSSGPWNWMVHAGLSVEV